VNSPQCEEIFVKEGGCKVPKKREKWKNGMRRVGESGMKGLEINTTNNGSKKSDG